MLAPSASAASFPASFRSRSYRPGQFAALHVGAGAPRVLHLEVLRAGAGTAIVRQDAAVDGLAVAPARDVEHHGGGPFTIEIGLGHWPSGVYFARLIGSDGQVAYAPFVLRPRQLGSADTLVVEPTNTWQAYNDFAGDSWYEDPAVHEIDLARPYLQRGLPPHFLQYDLGFLRWAAGSGAAADYVSDDDLARFTSAGQLAHLYRLIVFPGHEEYVSSRVYALVEAYRNEGGDLAFLSADNFFYRVTVDGAQMLGRTRWRDLGRPEAALVGAGYSGWDERAFGNRPLVVTDVGAAPWLFAGTGLHDGSRFGLYGIEIDSRSGASPSQTHVLADIPDEFGPGLTAQMTYYRRGRSQVFDAGVMNFGGSTASWPAAWTIMRNLWLHFGGRLQGAAGEHRD